MPQASCISPDADLAASGPTAAAVTQRVKAATKLKLENVRLSTANRRKIKKYETRPTVQAARGKIKKVPSESSLGRYLTPGVRRKV